MSNDKQKPQFVRLNLTSDQKATVKDAIGQEAEAIELTAKELEERIAPAMRGWE